jgi:hypothetical protein
MTIMMTTPTQSALPNLWKKELCKNVLASVYKHGNGIFRACPDITYISSQRPYIKVFLIVALLNSHTNRLFDEPLEVRKRSGFLV